MTSMPLAKNIAPLADLVPTTSKVSTAEFPTSPSGLATYLLEELRTYKDFWWELETVDDNGPKHLAGKIWSQDDTGKWVKKDYSAGSYFRYRVRGIDDIHDIYKRLMVMQSNPRLFTVRGDLDWRDLFQSVNGTFSKRRPIFISRKLRERHDVGFLLPADHCFFLLDIDDAPAPKWLNPNDKASLERAIEWLINKYLPPCFQNVTVVYQWSASAAVKGWDKLRIHLWFFSSRSVCDDSLRSWIMRHSKSLGLTKDDGKPNDNAIDWALFNAVQPHYTAAPVFVGGKDPLEGRRLGIIEGGRDVVDLPGQVVDLATQAQQNASAQQKQRRPSELAEGPAQRGSPDLVDVGSTAAQAGALEVLEEHCEVIRSTDDCRYDTINREAFYAGGLAATGFLDTGRVVDAVLDAVAQMTRPHRDAHRTVPDSVAAGAKSQKATDSAINKIHRLLSQTKNTALHPYPEGLHDEYNPERFNFSQDGEEAEDPAEAPLALSDIPLIEDGETCRLPGGGVCGSRCSRQLVGQSCLLGELTVFGYSTRALSPSKLPVRTRFPLGEAREKTHDLLRKAVKEGGAHVIRCAPNTGKTTSAQKLILERTQDNFPDSPDSYLLVGPTNDMLTEKKADFFDVAKRMGFSWGEQLDLQEDITILPTRKKTNCENFQAYKKIARVTEKSGKFCKSCPFKGQCAKDGYIAERNRAQKSPVVLTTHHNLHRLYGMKTTGGAAQTIIDYTQIVSSFVRWQWGGGGFAPRVRRTQKQHEIIVEPVSHQGTGWPAPVLVWKRDFIGDDTGGGDDLVFRPTPAGKRKIRLWLATCGNDCSPTKADIVQKYSVHTDIFPFDVVIIDESPIESMHRTLELTWQNAALLRRFGYIREQRGRLDDAFRAATKLSSGGRRRSKFPKMLGPEKIAQIFPTVTDTRARAPEELLDYLRNPKLDPKAEDFIYKWYPDAQAVEALSGASQNGYEGCYFKGETLYLHAFDRLDDGIAPTRILLDATADEHGSKVIVPHSKYHKIEVGRPNELEVIQIKTKLTKGQVDRDGANGPSHDQLRMLTAAGGFTKPGALHIVSKNHNPNAQKPEKVSQMRAINTLLRDKRNDRFIHHKGTKARGSNEFESCSEVVVDTFKIPGLAINQRAYILEQLARDCGYAETVGYIDWRKVAGYQMEIAPVTQALHRIRFNAGANRLIIVDERDPELLCGYRADVVIGEDLLDLLTFKMTGSLPQRGGSK